MRSACSVDSEGQSDWQEEAPLKKKARSDGPKVDVSAAQGSSTVFVKNLPWSADEHSLREFFGECGAVASVRVGALPVLAFVSDGVLHSCSFST